MADTSVRPSLWDFRDAIEQVANRMATRITIRLPSGEEVEVAAIDRTDPQRPVLILSELTK